MGEVDLSAGLNLGDSFTDAPGGTATWTFSGGTNYNDQSGDVAIEINKADATVTVTGYTGTYDAASHGATGTATGVGGVDLSAGLGRATASPTPPAARPLVVQRRHELQRPKRQRGDRDRQGRRDCDGQRLQRHL